MVDTLYHMFDGIDSTCASISKRSSNYPTVTLTLKNNKFYVSKIYAKFILSGSCGIEDVKFYIKTNSEWIEINNTNSHIGYINKPSGESSIKEVEIILNESFIIDGFKLNPTYGRNETNTYTIYDVYFEGYEIEE